MSKGAYETWPPAPPPTHVTFNFVTPAGTVNDPFVERYEYPYSGIPFSPIAYIVPSDFFTRPLVALVSFISTKHAYPLISSTFIDKKGIPLSLVVEYINAVCVSPELFLIFIFFEAPACN